MEKKNEIEAGDFVKENTEGIYVVYSCKELTVYLLYFIKRCYF